MNELETAAGEPAETTQEPPVIVEQAEGVTEGQEPKAEPKQELTEVEKKAHALERRVARLTRDRYRERAELEAEITRLRAAPKEEGTGQTPQLTDEEVERRAEAKAAEITEAKAFNDRCNEVFTKGKKAYAGFVDDLRTVVEEVGPLFDKSNKPTPLMRSILDTEEPHRILKHLADNPDVATELADLSERQQFRRLVLLEKEIEGDTRPKPSTAPKPVAPVKGGASGGSPDPEKDPLAWIAARNKQQGRG